MAKPDANSRFTKLVSNALDAAAQTYADRARLTAIIDQFARDGTTEDEVLEYLRRLVAIQTAYPGQGVTAKPPQVVRTWVQATQNTLKPSSGLKSLRRTCR